MSTESNTHALGGTSPETVMGRVDEAVCAFDDDWQITFINDQAAAMLEHSPEELLGHDIWTVVPSLDETVIGDQLREAMATGTPTRFERYNENRDRWFKIRIYPDDDGATACFYDITDERGDELETQRQRRLFETVFAETEDALIVADTDRRITDFNPAAEQLFGYDASEVIGETARLLYADDDEYGRQGDKRFNEDAPLREETYRVEYERADGTTFIGESLGTSLKDSDGETIAFLGSIRDASARIEYEQTLEAHTDTLQTFHDISTDDDRSADERIDAVLELGCEHLGLDIGILSSVEDTNYTVEGVNAPDDSIQPGEQFDLDETFCDRVVDSGEVVTVTDAANSDLAEHPAYKQQGLESYIGVEVVVDGERYGTLNFSQPVPREQSFTESERTLVRLFAQWIGKELSRQQNKQRAAANRDRLRQIIDLLPQLVFAKDRDNEYILANQATADAYGTTVEDVEGSTDADFVSSAAEAEQFRQDDLAVIDSGEPKHIPEEPLTKADGETVTLQMTKIPYDPVDHDSEAVLGVATDISERKSRDAEIELQSAAMEVAMDGIAILDGDEYVYMNQAHADIFDYESEELLDHEWRDLYGDDEIERLEAEVFPELADTGSWRGETIGKKQDGTPVTQDLGLALLDSGELICTNRDITAQKQREKELQQQRSQIRALFDNSPDGIVIHDADGAVLDVNETTVDTLGYDRETLTSMNVAEFEVGINQSELAEICAEIEPNETLKVEGEHRRQNGETFPVEVWVNKVEVGGNVRYIAVSRDITEQKRLETSLRESEQSLRELTSIASGTDRGFEDKLRALLELGAERLGLPYGFLNRIDNETQHVVQAVGDHPELQTGASASKEETYCRKTIEQSTPLSIQNAVDEGWEGDRAYERFDLGCYIGGSVTVDGSFYGTLCFADRQHRGHEFTDTERTFVELLVEWISHELSRSSVETKLRQINETGQQFMSVPSKEQIAALAVESAESIVDVSAIGLWWYDEDRDALLPERAAEAATEHVSEQPVFERGTAVAWEAFDTGEVQVYNDLSAVDRTYNEQTAFNSETIVPLGSHGVLCAGSVDYQSFSETEINLLEVLSSTVEAALARAERETELRETQAALKQSNEELEQFAYAASHDLQEPLRTVSSYLTLLERRYGEELDGDATEFIEFAVDGADRMREMIQALLAYSRVDTRGESFEAVDLSTCFERVTDSLGVKIAETDATVSTPSTAATVEGDRSQLAQLFQNLVDNGIKYNRNQPEIDLSAHRHDGMVSIEVTDNGIGMEADQTDEIFEVFQRLHTREEFEGTGIGLSICRKIVDRHGGEIEVESQPGEGSTVTITLPEGDANA